MYDGNSSTKPLYLPDLPSVTHICNVKDVVKWSHSHHVATNLVVNSLHNNLAHFFSGSFNRIVRTVIPILNARYLLFARNFMIPYVYPPSMRFPSLKVIISLRFGGGV